MTEKTNTAENTESAETSQRKGFVSPLQKAQAGKIGGGKEQSQKERKDATTSERSDIETSENDTSAKKNKREETHFRQTVWMPKGLNHRLKVHAARIEDDVSGIINKLVEEYLNREED